MLYMLAVILLIWTIAFIVTVKEPEPCRTYIGISYLINYIIAGFVFLISMKINESNSIG